MSKNKLVDYMFDFVDSLIIFLVPFRPQKFFDILWR